MAGAGATTEKTTPSPKPRHPITRACWLDCPHALLRTSGGAVGFPHGQMGNSEVGHMNIGSGRVVAQDLPRIDVAIEDGSLGNRPALRELITKAKAAKGGVHLMGLLSPGGVHSHQDHMAALVRILAEAKLPVFVHAFLDGRDTPPRSASGFIEKFLKDIEGVPGVRMATVSGRYYAMDRDARWDRVKKGYDALVDADAPRYATSSRRSMPLMPKMSTTNSSYQRSSAIMPAWPMAMRCCSPISAPTARGKFPWRCWIKALQDLNGAAS